MSPTNHANNPATPALLTFAELQAFWSGVGYMLIPASADKTPAVKVRIDTSGTGVDDRDTHRLTHPEHTEHLLRRYRRISESGPRPNTGLLSLGWCVDPTMPRLSVVDHDADPEETSERFQELGLPQSGLVVRTGRAEGGAHEFYRAGPGLTNANNFAGLDRNYRRRKGSTNSWLGTSDLKTGPLYVVAPGSQYNDTDRVYSAYDPSDKPVGPRHPEFSQRVQAMRALIRALPVLTVDLVAHLKSACLPERCTAPDTLGMDADEIVKAYGVGALNWDGEVIATVEASASVIAASPTKTADWTQIACGGSTLAELETGARIRCPFHVGGSDRSFVVLAKAQRGYCHSSSCGCTHRHVIEAPALVSQAAPIVDGYLQVYEPVAGTCAAYKAALGLGKTHSAAQVLLALIGVVVVAPTRALTAEASRRYEVAHYEDDKRTIKHGDSYATTPHSLWRMPTDGVEGVVLEELTTILAGLVHTNPTHAGNAQRDLRQLESLVRRAPWVIVLDADLDELAVQWLRRLRPSVDVFLNEVPADRTAVYTDSPTALLVELAKAAKVARKDGLKVYLASSSKGYGLKAAAYLASQAPQLSVLCLNSETAADHDLRDIDALMTDYDVLIASPVISTGVSIDRIDFGQVFAYYGTDSIPATELAQLIARVRTPRSKDVVIYANPTDREDIESTVTGFLATAFSEYEEARRHVNASGRSFCPDVDCDVLDGSYRYSDAHRLYAQHYGEQSVKALQGGENSPRRSLTAQLTKAGWSVLDLPTKPLTSSVKAASARASRAVKAAEVEKVLEAADVVHPANHVPVSSQEVIEIRRASIVNVFGLVSPELAAFGGFTQTGKRAARALDHVLARLEDDPYYLDKDRRGSDRIMSYVEVRRRDLDAKLLITELEAAYPGISGALEGGPVPSEPSLSSDHKATGTALRRIGLRHGAIRVQKNGVKSRTYHLDGARLTEALSWGAHLQGIRSDHWRRLEAHEKVLLEFGSGFRLDVSSEGVPIGYQAVIGAPEVTTSVNYSPIEKPGSGHIGLAITRPDLIPITHYPNTDPGYPDWAYERSP